MKPWEGGVLDKISGTLADFLVKNELMNLEVKELDKMTNNLVLILIPRKHCYVKGKKQSSLLLWSSDCKAP